MICRINECDKPTAVKVYQLCSAHYARFKRHGDPLVVKHVQMGQTSHPMYRAFNKMLTRCRLESDGDYGHYGARGIKVCDRWSGVNGFLNFLQDMGERPEGKTLDRIDNDGDYTPENCRWADKELQAQNTRIHKTNPTGHRGISKGISKAFRVRISVNNRSVYCGQFDDINEAIKARMDAEIKYWRKATI